jgi:hypothetical protein
MRRWISPDRPTDSPAKLALWLGAGSFIPAIGPAVAILCALVGAAAWVLCARYPERYTGKPRIYLAFALAAAGLLFFVGEASLFLRWKLGQEYEQKTSVSRFRLAELSQGLEKYREQNGAYPTALGVLALEETLEPKYLGEVPIVDGFGQALSAESRPEGFTLQAFPPPSRSGRASPEPLVVRSTFSPAPPPPPSPPPAQPPGDESSAEAQPAPAPAPAPEGGSAPQPAVP